MNSIAVYALAAVLTLGGAYVVTYKAGTDAADASLQDDSDFSHEVVRNAAKEAMDALHADRLSDNNSEAGAYLGSVQTEIRDIQERQKELIGKVNELVAGGPKITEGDNVDIPGDARLQELVAAAMVNVEEQKAKERTERRKKQREERAERRKKQTMDRLTEALKLDSRQVESVAAIMSDVEAKRRAITEEMRSAREAGGNGNFDWTSMRDKFREMGESTDKQVKEILNPDQQALYETYKKENPFSGLGSTGGARTFPRRQGGGNGGGGRRRGGN